MEQKYLDHAEQYPALGPHYLAAREVAETFMAKFQAEHFEPLIKKATDDFYSKMHEALENYLLSDVESNIQNVIWRQIDDSVKALLSGHKWALERYALGARYEHEEIRKSLARLIPAELQDKRVSDLEAEVAGLREQLNLLRQFR